MKNTNKHFQEPRQHSSAEDFSIRNVGEKMVDYYLNNDDVASARTNLFRLATALIVFDETPQAVRAGIERIREYTLKREAEAQANAPATSKAEAPANATPQPSATSKAEAPANGKPDAPANATPDAETAKDGFSDEHIRQCIARLMLERTPGGKPLFCHKNHWQAVFRILADEGLFGENDYKFFDQFMGRVMPDHVNAPYTMASVKSISQTEYCRPFSKWTFDGTAGQRRTPFEHMQTLARRFRELLYAPEEPKG